MLLIHGTARPARVVARSRSACTRRCSEAGQGERAAAARRRAARVPDRLARRGRTSARTRRWTPSSTATCVRRAERWRPAATARPHALFARAAARRAGRHLRPPVAAHAGAGRVSVLLRARRGRARLGRRRQRVHRPDVLVRADRPRPPPSARRRGGAPAGGGGRLLQRPGRGVGRAGRAAGRAHARGRRGRSSRRTAPTSAPGRRRSRAPPPGGATVLVAEGAYHGAHAWCYADAGGRDARGPRPRRRASATTTSPASTPRSTRTTATCAAIIVSPFRHDAFHDQEMAAPGFLAGLRARCDRLGAVLILDDVRAGFRLHLGGSGERVGVQPDLTCYSQGARQRLPDRRLRSAAMRCASRARRSSSPAPTGRAPCAMAAALACLAEIEASDAIAHMARLGTALRAGLERQAAAHGLGDPLHRSAGDPVHDLRRRRGLLRAQPRVRRRRAPTRGVYLHPHHNWFLSAALGEADVDRVLEVTDGAFAEVARREA